MGYLIFYLLLRINAFVDVTINFFGHPRLFFHGLLTFFVIKKSIISTNNLSTFDAFWIGNVTLSFLVTEIERRGALDLSEPLEKMLPFLGISLDGKYKPALVFKEDDPLGISVITQRLEGKIWSIPFQGYLLGKLFSFKVIRHKCYFMRSSFWLLSLI